METVVLRDAEMARRYIVQGLWLQRATQPTAASTSNALTWSLAVAEAGHSLPPSGLIADMGNVALGRESSWRASREARAIARWPSGMARAYEDLVLGKFYADSLFERASDAIRSLEPARQALGLTYVVKQFLDRAQLCGVELSPGIVRGLLQNAKPEEVLRKGWESLAQHGPLPMLIKFYEQLISACRRLSSVLALEDVIALEQRTALLSMAEYVAHRQVLQLAARLQDALPAGKILPRGRRRDAPTYLLDEDAYPVGGFASISTRGTIESLLHSQLAYMERGKQQRPDLFDIKFLRDELYYYSRDENQFLRRRRAFYFVLAPELTRARFKDPELPAQRLVLALALLLAAVRKLSEWLGEDSLYFEFVGVRLSAEQAPLAEELKLLRMLFRDQLANGTVGVSSTNPEDLAKAINARARQALTHCLVISLDGYELNTDPAPITHMRITGARPKLFISEVEELLDEVPDPFDAWSLLLIHLLEVWV